MFYQVFIILALNTPSTESLFLRWLMYLSIQWSFSDTFIYIVAVRDNGTNSEDTVGAQTNFIPAEEFYTYLDEPGFGRQLQFH